MIGADGYEERELRLECLRLAVAEVSMDASDTVARARTYAEFVLNEGGERDV